MDDDHGNETRELRLEGVGLFVIGALLLAALAGAFYLGRWVERRATVATTFGPAATDLEPTGAGQLDDADVGAGHFDELSGGEKEAEPGRQAVKPTEAAVAAPTQATAAPPPAEQAARPDRAGGSFYVQVFAGQGRSSAEELIQKLGSAGYPVRLHTDREGQTTMYKVRVGGYATDADARAVMARLKTEHPGAWVTKLD